MSSFSFEKAELEMKDRCPMFYTMLKSASMSQCNSNDGDVYGKTSIVIAASVCLKNRSQIPDNDSCAIVDFIDN